MSSARLTAAGARAVKKSTMTCPRTSWQYGSAIATAAADMTWTSS